MKRFTDTDKWRDPWFRGLTGPAKMLWIYLTDTCDRIGVCEINFKFISADTNLNITEKHLTELGDRIQVLDNGEVFLRKFIDFQYGELTPSCPPHRKLIQAIERIGLRRVGSHFEFPQSLGQGYPSTRVQEEEKDKEEDQEGGNAKGGFGRPNPRFSKPKREELDLQAAKIGLPAVQVDRFVNYYESNGWKVGRNPMKSWSHALTNWKLNWEQERHGSANNDRNRHIAGANSGGKARIVINRREAENKASAQTPGPGVGAKVA